ncbi:LytR/AlgR family response regulator transcription factor [Winogradskyella sp.]|uniref:LytR/AlgR family response regulator transcription factor n=1 Tax=Winogradskyella sp. TaxID=1883156 RepID=UPI003BAD45A4
MEKSLNIIIVEDEPIICATIETALVKAGHNIVDEADTYEDALDAISDTPPDLVIIDIHLHGQKDGIDLAMELDRINLPYLYLTSQTDPETIDRVKSTNPLGYIVKPFTESGLQSNIELAWFDYTKKSLNSILIKHEGSVVKVLQNDILYLKAFDNYCYIITKDQQYLVPHTLKHMAQQLDEELFLKTHRSYIVNMSYVATIEKKAVEIMGDSIPLSSAHRTSVLDKLSRF